MGIESLLQKTILLKQCAFFHKAGALKWTDEVNPAEMQTLVTVSFQPKEDSGLGGINYLLTKGTFSVVKPPGESFIFKHDSVLEP